MPEDTIAVLLLFLSASGCIYFLGRRPDGRTILPPGETAYAPWSAIDSAFICGVFLAMGLLASIAASALAGALGRRSEQAIMVLTIALTYTLNLATLYLVYQYARRGGRPASAMGFAVAQPFESIAFGFVFFLLFVPFEFIYPSSVDTAWRAVFHSAPRLQTTVEFFQTAPAVGAVAIGIAAGIIAPIVEETVFRGFIQRGFENTFGVPLGILSTAILFSAIHGVGGGVATIIEIFPLALLLSVLYARTRNIVINIAFHASFNTSSLLLLLAQRYVDHGSGVDLGQLLQ
jgi:membrane protease YdiL (CAAX protease family)